MCAGMHTRAYAHTHQPVGLEGRVGLLRLRNVVDVVGKRELPEAQPAEVVQRAQHLRQALPVVQVLSQPRYDREVPHTQRDFHTGSAPM